MYSSRIGRVVSRLKTPAYLVTFSADIHYLAGIPLEGFWLLLTREGAVAFASPLLAGHLRCVLDGIKVIEASNILKAFERFCKINNVKEIGFNPQKLSFALAGKLAAKVTMRPVEPDPVEAERIIKDTGEIEKIRKSCRLAVRAYEYAGKLVRPGVTEEQ